MVLYWQTVRAPVRHLPRSTMFSSSRKRSIRIVVVGAFLAVASMLGAVLVAEPASAATVSLSGTVKNDSGATVAGVTVTAYELYQIQPIDPVATTTTSSTGAFSFPSLDS